MENGQIHLVINATESSTASFLQNNLSDLRQSLAQSGIDFGTLEMGSDNNRNYNPQEQYHPEEDSIRKVPDEDKNYYPEFVSARLSFNAGSRINIKA